jgi:hypothetical protein
MATSLITTTEQLAPLELLRGEIQDGAAQTKIMEYPLLNSIQKESAFQTSIDWVAQFGGADVYGRANTANPSGTSNQDSNLQAVLPIGSRVIEHKFSIDLVQATQALLTAPAALRNLYRGKINAGLDAILKQLEILAYTGDGQPASHGIVGLNKVITNVETGTPNTDKYAGIDGEEAVTAGWKAYQNTNGSLRNVTTTLLRATATGMGKLGANYNLVMTNWELADSMEALFESRLAVDQVGGTTDLGFTGLTYQGRPVKKSIYCPANIIYFLNTSDIKLYTYALQPAMSTMAGGASEVVPYNGLNILVTRMPQVNPHSVDFLLSVQAQMQVFNRRSVARLAQVQ